MGLNQPTDMFHHSTEYGEEDRTLAGGMRIWVSMTMALASANIFLLCLTGERGWTGESL